MTRYVQMHEMFQGSYNKLDGSIKSRVLNFMVKLQQDPCLLYTSPSPRDS